MLFSAQRLPGPTTGIGICGVPSVLTQGPSVVLQTPHLASSQDLDSRLSATEAPPLIPGPQSLEDPDVRKSAHACGAHPAPTVALDGQQRCASLRSPQIRGQGPLDPLQGPQVLQLPWESPPLEAPPHMRGPHSETRMSGSETMHFGLITSQIHQGPTAAPGFSEVSSDWGPRSPQSSLRVLKLKPWRSWASSLCSPEATPPFLGPQFP